MPVWNLLKVSRNNVHSAPEKIMSDYILFHRLNLDWDSEMIEQWKAAKNEMAVLTTYPSDVDGHYNKTSAKSLTKNVPKMCNTDFDDEDDTSLILIHGQQPSGYPDIQGEPTLQPFWAAGFSFARGHFTLQLPYDQYLPMVFQGEEISMTLRGFTYGYDFYTPDRQLLFHDYSQDGEQKVNKFWKDSLSFQSVRTLSEARLIGIAYGGTELKWNNLEEKKYGLGKIRSAQKFFDTFGIDIRNKKIQQNLCNFVGKAMNSLFTPHMKEHLMGINYDEISFKFQDPEIKESVN